MEATPIAIPPTARAATNSDKLWGTAAPTAETPNRIAERISIRRRPNLSLRYPAMLAPATQPTRRLVAATSVQSSVRPNSRRKKMSAPLMTAVSKPNSSPEAAATIDTI